MDSYCVYKHTTPCGKIYIGITGQDVSSRWKNGRGYERNPYFWKAIQKYGWQNIKHEILCDSLSKEEAERIEILLITEHDSTNPEKGYNIDNGGNSVGKRSEATKAKISLKNRGKIRTVEMRQKMSQIKRGCGNHNYGKHFSEEHRQKIGDAQRGGKHPFAKSVVQMDGCGVVINAFASTTEAERATGISRVCIGSVCNGKHKTAGGYHWRFGKDKDLEMIKAGYLPPLEKAGEI